ncbi:malate dehydrogenase [Priestia filamentosa]|nr:malate dehydrogenase [Priestia filamentosa]
MTMRRKKISVIGAGFTGATTAFLLGQKELGDVVLVDIPNAEGPTKGKALDMLEASPIEGFDSNIVGTSNYEDTANSDVVIITAGIARKPGMSRDDLVTTNQKVMKSVTQEIVKYSPDCHIIVLTNPVSVKDVTGFVLGGHGDDMVPLVRYSYAGGIPLETLIPKERLDAIVERTRKGGGEIVGLLGNGSAYYAPAASLVEMTEAIVKDQRRILPSIAYLEGEYGYQGIYLGVPTVLGGNGIEQVIELELTDPERAQLDQSAESVKKVMSVLV